jgi:2-desacetyl-2-hydroxyethyl bacteriochlorophyllide A dehydrogenase
VDLLRVVAVTEPGHVEVQELARPQVRPEHVLIETQFSSISAGTELLVLAGTLPGVHGGVVRYPLVPGYENVGRIVEVGPGVSRLREGDWVVSEGATSFSGLHSCWGAHAELVHIHADDVFRLPDGLAHHAGVFMVLTSIALHALQRGRVTLGDDVAIFGQGVVGLLATQIAKAMGARRVVGVDRLENRLRAAGELGADHTVNAPATEDALEQLAELSAGRGFDVVVEATGAAEVARVAPRAGCERGRLVLAGMYTQPLSFDYWQLYTRELDVAVSRQAGPRHDLPDPYYRWTWRRTNEESLALLASGQVHVEPLISHRLPVEEISRAYEQLRSHPDETIKVLLEWR